MTKIANRIVAAIQKEHPSLKTKTINKKYEIYYNAVLEERLVNLTWRDSQSDENQLNKSILSNLLGTYFTKGKSGRWLALFEEFAPLYKTITKGSNYRKKISNVEFNMEHMDEFISYDIIHKTFEQQFEQAQETKHLWSHVDMESIAAYIHKQKQYKFTAYKQHHIAALDKSIVQATCLLQIAQKHGGQIPQYAERALSGRMYYKGFNLQVIKSEVREAAFGDGFCFDIKASAFALMIEMVIAMGLETREDAEQKYKVLISYIQNRDEDRKLISNDVLGDCSKENIKKIKQALTSIGFGAKKSNFYKNAIPNIFKDTMVTNKFNEHYLVKSIVSEFSALQDMVWEAYKDDDVIEFIPDFPYKELRKVKSKVLAHLYQSFEAFVVLQVLPNLMVNQDTIPNILWVHDGFYTTDPGAMTKMKRIAYELQKTFPLIQFDSDKLNKWKKREEISEEELEHKRFIAEQEHTAQTYVPNNVLEFKS